MMNRPYDSPWGEIQHCLQLYPGVYSVCTARHGGIMVHSEAVEDTLSAEAQKCALPYNRYLCFEEDCDEPVALRELMDKGYMKVPVNEHFKPGEFEAAINRSLRVWHPDYWKARQADIKRKQEHER